MLTQENEMKRLKNKLEQLKFAIYCFGKGKDTRFVRSVKQLEHSDNMVYLESYGQKKSCEIIYFIDMEASYSGFFADHNRLLALLYFADRYGMKPVVKYHSEYCYAENHPVNNTTNPFEYYFKQPCGMTLDYMKEYNLVVKSRKENSYLINQLCEDPNGYRRSEQYLDEMARITAKYIHLNDTVSAKILLDIEQLLGNQKVLAVHVRGTDFNKNFNGHPVSVGINEYLDETVRVFEEGNYNKVFLATDDSEALKKFKAEFRENIVFYDDVTRSSEKDTVMHSKSNRHNHHYLLGLEVLRDMYTLAACEGLIAGLSQVSYAARIQKKSTGSEYKHLVILDKGINFHKNRNCPNHDKKGGKK